MIEDCMVHRDRHAEILRFAKRLRELRERLEKVNDPVMVEAIELELEQVEKDFFFLTMKEKDDD